MALPKKGLRKITVGTMCFAWSATGNDEYIGLTVVPLDADGQVLCTGFGYQARVVDEGRDADGNVVWQRLRQQLVITPYLVRQVIEYALQHGWRPSEKGQFSLPGIESHLDLRLGNGAPPALR